MSSRLPAAPRPLALVALAASLLAPHPALARQASTPNQAAQPDDAETTPSPVQNAQPGVQTGAQPGTQSRVQTGAQQTAQPESQTGSPTTPSAIQPAPDSGRQTTLPPSSSPLQPLPGSGSGNFSVISPITTPTVSPGALTLLEQDGRLSQAVAAGGGKAFAEWFAPDAVTLNNGKPAIQGRTSIAASATWTPADYQLSWIPQGASMGPSNDMGYTWGSYQGRARDRNGQTLTTTGRYITIWQKQHDSTWKISLEASADDAPAAGSCCKLPTTP